MRRRDRDGLVHLHFQGRLGATEAAATDRRAALTLSGATREEAVIDRCDVTGVDATTVAWLRRCDRWAAKARARLTILVGRDRVFDALRTTDIVDRLLILDGTSGDGQRL